MLKKISQTQNKFDVYIIFFTGFIFVLTSILSHTYDCREDRDLFYICLNIRIQNKSWSRIFCGYQISEILQFNSISFKWHYRLNCRITNLMHNFVSTLFYFQTSSSWKYIRWSFILLSSSYYLT